MTGPLELTRRQKVLVWDDEIEVEDDTILEIFNPPLTLSPRPSIRTMPLPTPVNHRRARSHSSTDAFPPPMRRTATEGSGVARPVPFVSKLPRVHPGTSGVTVLEHMERVDAVEAGLRRLAIDDSVIEEEDEDDVVDGPEEVDVGMTASTTMSLPIGSVPNEGSSVLQPPTSPSMSPNVSSGPHVDAIMRGNSSASSSEEDLVAMSKSTPQLDPPVNAPFHARWSSAQETEAQNDATRQSLEWMRGVGGDSSRKKTMIIEVRICTAVTVEPDQELMLRHHSGLNRWSPTPFFSVGSADPFLDMI